MLKRSCSMRHSQLLLFEPLLKHMVRSLGLRVRNLHEPRTVTRHETSWPTDFSLKATCAQVTRNKAIQCPLSLLRVSHGVTDRVRIQ